jgi:hypothetical protein
MRIRGAKCASKWAWHRHGYWIVRKTLWNILVIGMKSVCRERMVDWDWTACIVNWVHIRPKRPVIQSQLLVANDPEFEVYLPLIQSIRKSRGINSTLLRIMLRGGDRRLVVIVTGSLKRPKMVWERLLRGGRPRIWAYLRGIWMAMKCR